MRPTLPFILLLAACGAKEPAADPPFDETPDPRLPDLQCRIEDGELRVTVMFSHGGSAFEHCGTECDQERTNVKLRITSPAPGSPTTTAFEQKEVRVPLEGTRGPIHLRLQQRVRGAADEPAFVLAKIVPR